MVRKTTQSDLDRFAENLIINSARRIQDRDSFQLELKRYAPNNNFSDKSIEKIFKKIKRNDPDILDKHLHKEAGGKSLGQDRLQTAKTVVLTEEEYIKRGAVNVDFAGYDVREDDIFNIKRVRKKGFTVEARSKGRIVFAKQFIEEWTFKKKGKIKVKIFRDHLGRFASIR